MISAFGMFNALVMSYSRLPLRADDMLLCFGRLQKKSRAPWVAIIALAMGWAMCLGLGFARLVTLDILLYGASLFLEFMALAVCASANPTLWEALRFRAAGLEPSRSAFPPSCFWLSPLSAASMNRFWGPPFAFGMILIRAPGFIAYAVNHLLKPAGWSPQPEEKPAT